MLNFGIVGCGHWGRNYMRVLHEIKGIRVVAASDLSRAHLESMKERYPLINTYRDYREIAENPQIHAVVVSTLATTHYRITRDCLKAGKHVLIEKPITLDPDEAKELIAMARKVKKILMVGHTFLYNDSVRKMKSLIHLRNMGRVYYLHARRNHLGTIREDVNVMWDLAPHDISIFSYLLEAQPLAVSAVGGRYLRGNREDAVFLTLFYPNGVLGNIHVSWVDSNKFREVVVIGSKRRVVFDDLNMLESIRVYQKGISIEKDVDTFGEFKYLLRDGAIISPKVEYREPLKNQCLHFVECIEQNKKPLTDGINGLHVVQVLTAAQESLKKNGTKVGIK